MWRKGRNVAEIQLPLDLIGALKYGNVTVILATFSDQGLPYAAPIHFIYPVGMSSLIFTIDKKSLSFMHLVWQKKIALCFLAKGNMVYTVVGRAGVIKAPSEFHPEMNIIRFETITVHREKSQLVKVDSGARFSPAAKELADVDDLLGEELETMAGYLV
jgi:hypothetical protein